MLIINYNIGKNSRSIIANEVYSTGTETFFSDSSSLTGHQDPLRDIQDYFTKKYPIPQAREGLEALSMKVFSNKLDPFWKSVKDAFCYTKEFSGLLEAAYRIRDISFPQCKVEILSKENLIPQEILRKSRKLSHILPFFPESLVPKDSLDPLQNLRALFSECRIEELQNTFKQWEFCTVCDARPSRELLQNHYKDELTFKFILDTCHLIYVRMGHTTF